MKPPIVAGAVLAAALALSPCVYAQSGAAVVGKGPGVAGAAQTVTIAATITAIDAASRAITLKGPQGKESTVVAGPEVKNFAQLKVGDGVDISFVESLVLELKKGGGKPVAWTVKEGAVGAKPGEKPAGAAGRQVTVVGDVIAVDTAAKTVTVKGPQRTVDLKVNDPEQLKLIAKGDQIEATFTEAMAVSVVPAKKK
jgi:Cu/Ag efflux protein CusF